MSSNRNRRRRNACRRRVDRMRICRLNRRRDNMRRRRRRRVRGNRRRWGKCRVRRSRKPGDASGGGKVILLCKERVSRLGRQVRRLLRRWELHRNNKLKLWDTLLRRNNRLNRHGGNRRKCSNNNVIANEIGIHMVVQTDLRDRQVNNLSTRIPTLVLAIVENPATAINTPTL